MSSFSWQHTIRPQVAIAGRVTEIDTEHPLPGVEIRLTTVPPVLQKRWQLQALATQPLTNPTQTRGDGFFYFLDLPPGEYGLRATVPQGGRRYQAVEQAFTLTAQADGTIPPQFLDLVIPTTRLRGTIQTAAEPVAMAQIQLVGSGDRVFSNPDGTYQFAALEASPQPRQVQVSAKGYATITQAIVLQAGQVHTLDFTLTRS
ncbi:carboxypeptidase regulatory-like domain-containing protein [Trichothermofontia sp.]